MKQSFSQWLVLNLTKATATILAEAFRSSWATSKVRKNVNLSLENLNDQVEALQKSQQDSEAERLALQKEMHAIKNQQREILQVLERVQAALDSKSILINQDPTSSSLRKMYSWLGFK